MADNLNINIRAKLDKQASQQQIRTDISQLENTPFFIRLIGKLHKALTKANVESDIKQLEKSVGSVRLNGRLNRNTTRQNIRSDIQNVARGNTVTLDARIDEQALENSVENVRNTVEQNLNNNPITVPINADTNIDNCTQDMRDFNNTVQQTRNVLADYLNVRDIFRAISDAIKKAVDNVEKLNKAETDLMIATQKSANEIKSLMSDYNQMAKDMSSTTIDVTGAADDYLRQGQSVADTNTLIRDSLILSKIGQIESAEATQYLTSSMKGYQIEAENVLDIVDKMSAVDLQSASNSSELAEAMSRCANVARTSGVELDTLIAYLAVTKDVTQDSANAIGNAWKSTFTRLNNIKIGKFLDEDGNDISGEINDAERVLSKFNISLRDNAKEFRNAQDVIADVAKAWKNMTSVEQAAVRKGFANTYQAEKFTALMENYNKVLELTEVSANSAGTALEKFSVYENSLEASTNRLTASLEGLAYNTISADFIKGLADGATAIVSFVDSTKLLQTGLTAGIFTGLISGVMALGTKMVALRNNVFQFTQAMNLSRQTSALSATQFQALRASVSGLTEAQLRLVISSNNLTQTQRLELMQAAGITQARQRQLLQTWNLTTATQAQTTATFSLRGAWEALKVSIASNPIGLIVTALTLATTVTNSLIQKQKELREQAIETANAIKDQSSEMKELVSQYEEILDSNKTDIEKTKELNEWKNTLIETYQFEAERLHDLNLEREQGIKLLKQEIALQDYEARANWLGNNSSAFAKAKSEINGINNSSSTDGIIQSSVFSPIFTDEVRDSIESLFSNIYSYGDGIYDFEVAGDNLIEKYENLQNIITKLGSANELTTSESILLDKLNKESEKIKKVLDEYQEIYETGYSISAENFFVDYTNSNSLKNVGQDSYIAWRDGLLATADGDKSLENELLRLAEEQFPDYAEYFNNLEKAFEKFGIDNNINDHTEGMKKIFLDKLSPEDLEIALQIPDLFAEGLDGATKKIEEWKSNPANTISPDIDTTDLSTQLEQAEKEISVIVSAMEEMADTGHISSSTYGELSELGSNFTSCLELQNGQLILNIEKLKELETQEYKNAISANELEIARLGLQINSPYDADVIGKQISALEKENAFYQELINEYNNAKPDESSGKSSSSDPNKEAFEREYRRREHWTTMGVDDSGKEYTEQMLVDWLDSAEGYKKYFSDLTKYQEEYWQYEEEVYNKRKQFAQDYFDTQRELMDENISALEEKIDTLSNESVDSDGNFLNPKEKFSEIRSAYTEILTYIDNLINEIVQSGVEGHEDMLAELEKQYEEYSDKLGDVFKDEIDSEIDYIQSLQDEWDKAYDNRIDHLEKEKSAVEERYDAEIKKIDDEIDALDEKNKAEEQTNKLIKARQELERAKRNKRLVFDPNGNAVYVEDTQSVNDAQQAVKEVETEIKVSGLEKEKEELEKQKEAATATIDDEIAVLKEQKAAQESYYSALLNILETYLNPKSTQSIESVWEKILSDPNVTVKDGSIDVKGQNVDTTAVTDGKVTAGTVSKELNYGKIVKGDEVAFKFLKQLGMADNMVNQILNGQMSYNSAISQTGSKNLNSVEQYTNPKRDLTPVNTTDGGMHLTIGDINVNEPVGSSENLADEIIKKFPNAMIRRIYKNR